MTLAFRAGESLFAFSDRVEADPYLVFTLNPAIDELTSRLGADDFVVPVTYGSKTEILLLESTWLPSRMSVWNPPGTLYERFDLVDVEVNPALGDGDFSAHNPQYGF